MDIRVGSLVLRPWIFRKGERPIASRLARWVHPAFVTLGFLAAAYGVYYVYETQGPVSISTAIWVTAFIGSFILGFTAFFVLPSPSGLDVIAYLLLGYQIVPNSQLAAERRARTLQRMSPRERLEYLWKEYMTLLRGGTPYARIAWMRDRIVPHLNARGLAAFEREESLAIAAGEGARRREDRTFKEGFMAGYMMGDNGF